MRVTRRVFLEGVAATAGMQAFGGTAPAEPKLRVGILSDIHLNLTQAGSETYFLKALQTFKEKGADAVVIAGDMADRGNIDELQLVADSWYRVFPHDQAEDGRHVEKIFIYGNHDIDAWKWSSTPPEKSLCADPKGYWEKIFHEPYTPVYAKTVKGYTFIGQHWNHPTLVEDFIEKTAPKLDPAKPFFYVQHAHLKNTCYGPWAWGAWNDTSAATKTLSRFPNAVAFSGHSHYSLTDERSLWQGAFTSIGTASLSYVSMIYGRENGDCDDEHVDPHMPQMSTQTGKQGMFLTIDGDRMAFERRDFYYGESLGPDWVLPIPCRGEKDMPYTFEKRTVLSRAPEFPAHAKVTLTRGKGKTRRQPTKEEEQVIVSFPAASFHDANDRVYDYEVQAQILECDTARTCCTKRVFAENYFLSDARVGKTGRCVFGLSELPKHARLRFAVRPTHCFGKEGSPLYSEGLTLASK